jgi:hypothetical protein
MFCDLMWDAMQHQVCMGKSYPLNYVFLQINVANHYTSMADVVYKQSMLKNRPPYFDV